MRESAVSKSVRLVLALSLLIPSVLAAHVVPMDGRERVAASPHIVVAVVEAGESRWNPQRSLVVTDYTLRIEDRLRGQAPERLTVSIPGGALGSVTDETCLTVRLHPGARYLLFLGDLDEPSLSPITGAQTGVYREVPGVRGSAVSVGEGRAPLSWKGTEVRFSDLVEATRELVAEVEASPSPRRAAAPVRELPAKGIEPLSVIHQPYVYGDLPRGPLVIDPIPAGAPFSSIDQQMMAYWNLYARDLFRVPATPSSSWAYGNGVFDIAGFPDDAQMKAQFDYTWGDLHSGSTGGKILGIMFGRRQDGVLTEADVALNPNVPWTLDDLEGTRRGSPYSFRHVMLHELGHMWGLKHPWETQQVSWDSVMNYKTKEFYLGKLYADDTTALRRLHPGTSIRDGLISSYITHLEPYAELPDYIPARPKSSSVRRGAKLDLNGPIKIENTGSEPLSKLAVEVYLTPRRFSFDGAARMKTVRIKGTLKSGDVLPVTLKKLSIPSSTRPGTYYLGFKLRDSKDEYSGNNSAWSIEGVTVEVK